MKVLLFVQTGDARPKCVKSFGNRKRNALAYFDAIAKLFGGEGQPERAWLVECYNADEGRELIYVRMAITAAHRYIGSKKPQHGTAAVCGSLPAGRIIASGGRP